MDSKKPKKVKFTAKKESGKKFSKKIKTDTEYLYLKGYQLVEVNLSTLQHFTQLKVLRLSKNQLLEVDLTPLQYCSQLQELYLNDNQLTEIDLTPLQQCTELKLLELDKTVELKAFAILKSAPWPVAIQKHHREIKWIIPRIFISESEKIKKRITVELSIKGKIDLVPLVTPLVEKIQEVFPFVEKIQDVSLHVEDISTLFSGDSDLIIWKHFIVTQKLLTQEVEKIISERGKISKESIPNGVFELIILESGIPGIFTRDRELFLTNSFVQKHLEDQIKIFTDIPYEEIASIFQIPEKYVEEILIEALKETIIVGKIDRSARRLLTKEKAVPLVQEAVSDSKAKDEYSVGSAFTVQRLMERFNCTETQIVRKIKEVLPHKSFFVTRRDDVVKIETLRLDCQICKTEISDNKLFECRSCKRHVCWDHFIELSQVGRLSCPECGGEVELLPKYCEKCSTDYLTASSKDDYCEFCGYQLLYPQEVKEFAKKAKVITSKKSLSLSQVESFSSKKDI